MLRSTLPALAAMAALLLGPSAVPASAQQTQQQPPAVEYGEQDLRAFAQASSEIQELNDQWLPQIAAAETPAEADVLRDEATSEMVEAIRDQGLSVQDYNAIFDQARQNPELASLIQTYQQDAQ